MDVHALSVVAHAVDEVTGEVSRARLCPDHGEIFCWLSLVRPWCGWFMRQAAPAAAAVAPGPATRYKLGCMSVPAARAVAPTASVVD